MFRALTINQQTSNFGGNLNPLVKELDGLTCQGSLRLAVEHWELRADSKLGVALQA